MPRPKGVEETTPRRARQSVRGKWQGLCAATPDPFSHLVQSPPLLLPLPVLAAAERIAESEDKTTSAVLRDALMEWERRLRIL